MKVPAKSKEQVVVLLEKLLPRNTPRQWSPLPTRFAVTDGYVLAASNAEQLTALKASRRTAAAIRSEADAAAAQVESHAAALVFFGDTDSRRVIREMFPPLRPPFAGIDGRLIADGIRWGGLDARHATTSTSASDPSTDRHGRGPGGGGIDRNRVGIRKGNLVTQARRYSR